MASYFKSYLLLEQLTDAKKTENGIKLNANTPRFDLTMTAGYCPELEQLRNQKGQVVFYLTESRGIINSPDDRRADRFLMGKNSFNFSSIYLTQTDTPKDYLIGFGNPPAKPTFGKNKIANPFYESRNDGFIFLVSPDWQMIEVLIIPQGKYTILGETARIASGAIDEAIQTIRESARPYYNY